MIQMLRARRLVAVGAVGAVAAGTALALAGGPEAAPASRPDRPFQALDRQASAADRPTAGAITVAGKMDVAPSATRRATLPVGAPSVTLVPGADLACLVVETPEDGGSAAYSCAPWADATAGELSLTLSGGPKQAEGEALVVGLVPDGTTGVTVREPDGGRTPATVNDGFYVAHAQDGGAVEVAAPAGTNVIELDDLPGATE